MEEKFMAVLEKLDKVNDEVNVNAVFGEPQTVEGRVIIPVAAVSYGVAVGTGTCMCAADIEIECGCDCEEHAEGECDCEDPETCECGCHDEESCECATPDGIGGASGGNARPIAIIEVTEDGATVKSIENEQVIALAGIALGAWMFAWIGIVLKTIFSPRK